MNVVTMLDEQAKRYGNRTAICHGDASITFKELSRQSCQGTNFLSSLGFGAGDVMLVFVPMSIDLYCILMSLWRMNMTALFLDPSSTAETMHHCLKRIQPKGFIGTPLTQFIRFKRSPLRKIPKVLTTGWLPFHTRWSGRLSCAVSSEVLNCNDDTPALITFTSGSTGIPKGTVRTHGFLRAQKKVLEKTLLLQQGKSDLATLPVFALINLASGVTTIIPSVSLKRPAEVDSAAVLGDFAKFRPETAVASPAFFERLLQDPSCDNLRCLESLYTGGAPVFPGLLKKLAAALPKTSITAVYGSTEAEPIAELKFEDIGADDFEKMAQGAGLLAGKVVNFIRCAIIENSSGRPLGPFSRESFCEIQKMKGHPGEIVVEGDHVLKGYLGTVGDAENKFRVDECIWHRTGDVGYFDEQGRLWLLGRCSAEVRDQKGTAYPFAIETAALQYPQVEKAAFCSIAERRVLIIETGGDFDDVKVTLEPVLRRFDIDRVERGTIPVDKRHNAKVDYPELLKKFTVEE